MATLQIPDPLSFDPLPAPIARLWSRFGTWDEVYFPSFVGLVFEEARTDYARVRLPYRPELRQPAGFVHGGALATLIDTVVVPAVGSAFDAVPIMLTVSMNIQYLGGVRGEDAIAHGWVVRRGRRIVFCEVAVVTEGGEPVATGSLVYSVRPPN